MTKEKIYGSDLNRLERWKLYGEMTDLGEISRRYFVMNFFDGVLTVLGIVIGSFILFLTSPDAPDRSKIVIQSLATSIAIGISGITGGFLSERAERKRNIIEMRKAMVLQDEKIEEKPLLTSEKIPKFKIEEYYPIDPIMEFEQNKNTEEKISLDPEPISKQNKEEIQKKQRTIAEQAESYASWIASIINGVAPAVGGFAVVIPFLFLEDPNWVIYVFSFLLIALLLFGLGAYLAKISKDSIWKYGIKMTLVGVFTAGLAFLLRIFQS